MKVGVGEASGAGVSGVWSRGGTSGAETRTEATKDQGSGLAKKFPTEVSEGECRCN